MHLASDYIHPTPRGGKCRVRIYLPEEEQDAPVVLCSELPNYGGTSVTYAAEQLAAEVIRSHESPTPLVRVEHWPKESTDGSEEKFELVIFRATRSRSVLHTWGRPGLGSEAPPGSALTAPPSRSWWEGRCRAGDATASEGLPDMSRPHSKS